ncbi:MAG: hypothetical protein ACYTE3_10160 [Planctomycetota bacterium]
MMAKDRDSHRRKALISGLIVLACVAFALGAYQYHAWMHRRAPSRANDREFHRNRHSSFLRQIERRDKIDDSAEYSRERAENTARYEQLKGKPQVVRGSLSVPAGRNPGNRLRMTLKRKRSETPARSAFNRTVVDDEMHFAFAPAEPGDYDLVLFETSTCPGVRLENVTVTENQPIPELTINIEDAAVEVTVRDAEGNVVVGGQVTVGKSCGGTNADLFTWRKGLTDSEGKFLAENLTDGQYVVSVYTQLRNGSTVIPVGKNEYREVQIALTHDNY